MGIRGELYVHDGTFRECQDPECVAKREYDGWYRANPCSCIDQVYYDQCPTHGYEAWKARRDEGAGR